MAIEIKFPDGEFHSVLSDAEFCLGPITFIDVKAEWQADADAVLVKLKGGDTILIATHVIDQRALPSFSGTGFLGGSR